MEAPREVIERLKAEPPRDVRRIAVESGVPYATLRKLRADTTLDPRLSTLEGLIDYYRRRDHAEA
jgi:hypothetical protein